MTAISIRTTPRIDPRAARPVALASLGVAAIVLFLIFQHTSVLLHDQDADIFRSLTGARDWVRDNRTINPVLTAVSSIREPVGFLASTTIDSLLYVGWLAVVGVGAALGFLVGGWRIAALIVVGLLCIGILGLWSESMQTLGLTISAVIVSLAIGVPLGILAARSKRFQATVSPVLDVMQIMPTFAYLAPMSLLFGIGGSPSTIATLVYAMPAAIRITALGIRRVPGPTVEAAESLGATRWQVLGKVQLPLARRVIGLAINQTIMMALGMVVITALIDAPGLGVPITRALFSNNVGAAFDAGIAVVILAILLDRLTEHASERLDPRSTVSAANGPQSQRRRRLLLGGPLAVAAVAIVASLQISEAFPDLVSVSFRQPVNAATDWIKTNWFAYTDAIKDGFSSLVLNPLQDILTTAPWWLIVAVAFGLALLVSSRRAAITSAICLLLIAGLQVWEHSMETLTTVLVATGLTLIVGLVLGILAARSNSFSRFLRPGLDFAQTMPSLVYLLPAVALFGPSRLTAILAALIYSAPPVVRLVEAGIRAVPGSIVEAATAYGATERQLLRKVRLPVSAPALLLAANQGIVMVLAMVVVGGLVGAGGLGYDVVKGFSQTRDFGLGLAGGIAIVLLGIMLDRITQGAGGRGPRVQRAAG